VAILLIILALFGFVFAGTLMVSTGASARERSPQRVTRHAHPWKSCVIVTWKKGTAAQQRPCPPPAKP
jgi:hypothetical protein